MNISEHVSYRTGDGAEVKPRLSRREASDYLRDQGLGVAAATLAKLASVGGGPGYSLFLGRARYSPDELLDRARSRLSAAGSDQAVR